jgi:hypothetical protein
MRRDNAIGACRPSRRFPFYGRSIVHGRTQNRSNISESCDDIGTCVLLDLQQENEVRRHDSARRICRRRAVVFMRMRTYPAAKLRTGGIAKLELFSVGLHQPLHIMPAHSRPKDGVASLAYVAGIHALAIK